MNQHPMLTRISGRCPYSINMLWRRPASNTDACSQTDLPIDSLIDAHAWLRRAEAKSSEISAEATTPSRLRLPQVSRTPASGSTLGS